MLHQLTIFSSLPPRELRYIHSCATIRKVNNNQVIFRQGQRGQEVMFIAQGKLKTSLISKTGRELLITYLNEGDFLGELPVLTGELHSADVIAVETTVLYVIAKKDFEECLKLSNFSKVFMIELAKRFYSSSNRFCDLVLCNVYQNVLNTLRDLATPQIHNGVEYSIITKRPTHQEIAALVGSSREVITRTLKELQLNRQIQIEGRKVILLNA